MFGDIGIEKIFLLLLVVLLLFGAKRIPEIGSSIGRGIREFKRSINDLQNEAHASDAVPVRPSRAAPLDQPPPGAPVGETRSEPKRLLT